MLFSVSHSRSLFVRRIFQLKRKLGTTRNGGEKFWVLAWRTSRIRAYTFKMSRNDIKSSSLSNKMRKSAIVSNPLVFAGAIFFPYVCECPLNSLCVSEWVRPCTTVCDRTSSSRPRHRYRRRISIISSPLKPTNEWMMERAIKTTERKDVGDLNSSTTSIFDLCI